MKANRYFEFLTFFEALPDTRQDRGQNRLLIDMVALALLRRSIRTGDSR